MNKYNNKKDEKVANEVMLAMIVITCIIVIVNYITI